MSVPVGRRTASLRRRDGTEVGRREEIVDLPKGRLRKLLGDGRAEVGKTVSLGVSRQVSDGLWLKGEVTTSVKLACDQSEDGVEKADEEAWELAMDKSLDGLDMLQDWADSLARSLRR